MIHLNTEHLKRLILTLQSSLDLYSATEDGSIEREVFRNAVVKGYELVHETTFELLRKALREFGHGNQKLDSLPVKEILRLGAVHGLLSVEEVERWFRYRDNRNNTAHDYGVEFARKTLSLLPAFIADVTMLVKDFDEKHGDKAGDSDGNN